MRDIAGETYQDVVPIYYGSSWSDSTRGDITYRDVEIVCVGGSLFCGTRDVGVGDLTGADLKSKSDG